MAEEDRKVFVGGLAQEATQDDLKEYFGQYGEIERVQLKMDFNTGRSRGFAFVVFASDDSVNSAINSEHTIKGKTVTVKKADVRPGKVYIGGLGDGISEDDIRNALSEYGTITEFVRPVDRSNNDAPKNFCFVTFEKERTSKELIQQGAVDVQGQSLQIKECKPNPRDGGGRGGGRGGRGGGGGYGGGYGGYGGGGGYGGQGGWDQGGYGGGWEQQAGGYGGYGGYGGGGKMSRGGGGRGGRGGGHPY